MIPAYFPLSLQWLIDDLINHMVMREAWYDIRWRKMDYAVWLIILNAGFNQRC
jgi:hypothetical protein